MLFAPLLAFLRPLLLFIGRATFFTNIEGLPVSLYLFDHCSFHSVYLATLTAVEGIDEPGVRLWRIRRPLGERYPLLNSIESALLNCLASILC